MHGLMGSGKEINNFQQFVQKYHPGTNVTVIDDYKYFGSFSPLWLQVEQISKKMQQIMKEHPDGVHLICYSQGGLICRGILETMSTHNVVNFISLSSPQAGQYGDTSYLAPFLPAFIVQDFYRVAYTESGQKLSVSNYWNDPHHQDLYCKWSTYLAVINNQSTPANHTNTTAADSQRFSADFRANFLRVKNVVLVGGPDDGVITPWQSSHFGSYNGAEEVVECHQQQFYLGDWFGLKTLDSRQSLHMCTMSGVEHMMWPTNLTVFTRCIEPWLV